MSFWECLACRSPQLVCGHLQNSSCLNYPHSVVVSLCVLLVWIYSQYLCSLGKEEQLNNQEEMFIYAHYEVGFRLTSSLCYLGICFNSNVEFFSLT